MKRQSGPAGPIFLALLLILALCALWNWNSAARGISPRLARESERDVAALAVMNLVPVQIREPENSCSPADGERAAAPGDPADRPGAGAQSPSSDQGSPHMTGDGQLFSELLPHLVTTMVSLSLAVLVVFFLGKRAEPH